MFPRNVQQMTIPCSLPVPLWKTVEPRNRARGRRIVVSFITVACVLSFWGPEAIQKDVVVDGVEGSREN